MNGEFHWLELFASVGYGAFLSCSIVMIVAIARLAWTAVRRPVVRTLCMALGSLLGVVIAAGVALTGVIVVEALESVRFAYVAGFFSTTIGLIGLALWLMPRPRADADS